MLIFEFFFTKIVKVLKNCAKNFDYILALPNIMVEYYVMSNLIIPFYRVNAFTNQQFGGNPATVVFLKKQFAVPTLYTQLAAEMGTPETAFVVPLDAENVKKATIFSLRWFMPTQEVKMCGHATQAAAFLVYRNYRNINKKIVFRTLSGDITATYNKETHEISLDFPVDTFVKATPSPELLKKLTLANYRNAAYSAERNLLIVEVENLQVLQALKPNFEALRLHKELEIKKVAITTKPAETDGLEQKFDFVSRCFCPWIGIDEDALSAATHTLLAKYWATENPQTTFCAWQASKRGGKITIVLKDHQRADLVGTATVLFQGELTIIAS
jgi:PhzF family phenazine biosynthesis protein